MEHQLSTASLPVCTRTSWTVCAGQQSTSRCFGQSEHRLRSRYESTSGWEVPPGPWLLQGDRQACTSGPPVDITRFVHLVPACCQVCRQSVSVTARSISFCLLQYSVEYCRTRIDSLVQFQSRVVSLVSSRVFLVQSWIRVGLHLFFRQQSKSNPRWIYTSPV